MTQQPAGQPDATTERYPLSFTQQIFPLSGRGRPERRLQRQDLPDFNTPRDNPENSQFLFGMYQPRSDGGMLSIADGAYRIFKRTQSSETSDVPSSLVWDIASSGDLVGNVVCNLDEFDEQTVTGWVADYNRLLFKLVGEPDREWRQLTGVVS